MNDKNKDFGKRLTFLRAEAGLTQKEAAKKIGVGYSTYQRYESGGMPSQRNIDKIISFFRCTYTWIVLGEGKIYIDVNDKDDSNFCSFLKTKSYFKSPYITDSDWEDLNKISVVVEAKIAVDEAIKKRNFKLSKEAGEFLTQVLYKGMIAVEKKDEPNN